MDVGWALRTQLGFLHGSWGHRDIPTQSRAVAYTPPGVTGGADAVFSFFLWPLNITLEVNLLSWREKIVVLTFQEIPTGKILKIKWVGLCPTRSLRGDK